MALRIQERFEDFLSQHKLLKDKQKVLLTTSGGVDSVVMCHLFSQSSYDFAIAHCNFQLRGEDADDDEMFVKKLAEKYQVPFYSTQFETLAYVQENKVSTQMAARTLRYDWFQNLSLEYGYEKIATAHHQNDVLETVLLNITRGTGLSGLHGIRQQQWLIRPLLFLTKEEILNFAQEQNLEWREDVSNASNKYKRNLIRNKVVPLLKEVNPNLEVTTEVTIQKMAGAEWLMNTYLSELKTKYFKKVDDKLIFLSSEIPQNEHTPFLCFELLKEYDFSYDDCKQISIAFTAQKGTQFLSDTHQMIKTIDSFELTERREIVQDEYIIEEKEGEKEFFEYGFVKREQVDFSNKSIVYLDADTIVFPLKVRSWEEGDIFKPLGMKGRKKKLSDFFVDEKLSYHDKRNIQILVDAQNEILAIIGYRTSECGKLRNNTSKIFRLMKK
ncbi:MAG: tRNA lysidine(34) synthetase TilS [Cytophagales bacterium]|nr:tRNA lysidine(34) synthetase TilS [Cytophagales bacterium]